MGKEKFMIVNQEKWFNAGKHSFLGAIMSMIAIFLERLGVVEIK